jgi:hypothetical protein
MAFVAAVLLIITLILNAITLIVYRIRPGQYRHLGNKDQNKI